MKEIKLTQGKVALVDDEDFEFLSQWSWYYLNGYARRTENIDSSCIFLHRAILKNSKDMEIDHINNDKLDNRRSNLRLCTHKENSQNRKIGINNTSGYKGVHKRPDGRWQARIVVNDKRVSLGYFRNISDAVLAYNDAAEKYYGEFANLNRI
ncbi:MAG: HNH endonuclease [Thermodesulfobacteriota bacterium]